MMALSSISDLPLFKRRSQEMVEFESLLDMLPHASIVVNRQGHILFSNSKASELSAFTRRELSELDLGTLFPNLDVKEFLSKESEGGAQIEPLITRRGQQIEASLRAKLLNGSEAWVAISIQTRSELDDMAAQSRRTEGRWEAMHVLSLAAQQRELKSSFRQILQAGGLLTGASHLALYAKVDGKEDLTLTAVHGAGLDFPASIPAAEIGHLREPKIWEAGKNIRSTLHKLAHSSKLRYLGTSPLDLTEAMNGILVVADERESPASDLISVLQILAASAATADLNSKFINGMQSQIEVFSKNNQLSRTLELGVQDGIIYLDQKLIVKEINPAAQSMLGYSGKEAIGRSANNILISSHPLLNSLVRAQSSGTAEDVGDIKLHRRDGSDLLANIRIVPIMVDDNFERIAIFISDLSENEALHVQSQQLQQRAWLGEVTAIFAHEVRNPINNISTGLQLMQMNLDEKDPLQAQITTLQEDCDRLEHRMKSVLSFSRSMDHNPEKLNIGDYCRFQLERWTPKMARHNIDQHLTVEDENLTIMGDRHALDQVFTNLINNSIQALQDQESGIIAVKIKGGSKQAGKGEVQIHFSDNGPGIPEDLRKRVFDPFFTTKESEGTGLGLAITKRIIQAHKGKIELESFPGGTLFKIKLPSINGSQGTTTE